MLLTENFERSPNMLGDVSCAGCVSAFSTSAIRFECLRVWTSLFFEPISDWTQSDATWDESRLCRSSTMPCHEHCLTLRVRRCACLGDWSGRSREQYVCLTVMPVCRTNHGQNTLKQCLRTLFAPWRCSYLFWGVD